MRRIAYECFSTNEEEKTIYTSVVDADLITMEMSKAEKKRYLKTEQK